MPKPRNFASHSALMLQPHCSLRTADIAISPQPKRGGRGMGPHVFSSSHLQARAAANPQSRCSRTFGSPLYARDPTFSEASSESWRKTKLTAGSRPQIYRHCGHPCNLIYPQIPWACGTTLYKTSISNGRLDSTRCPTTIHPPDITELSVAEGTSPLDEDGAAPRRWRMFHVKHQ